MRTGTTLRTIKPMKQSDLAIDRNGDILVLVTTDEEPFFTLTRCNSRGELPIAVEIVDLPMDAGGASCFKPSAVRYQDGLVFLQDHESNSFVAIDEAGHCLGKIRSLNNCANTLMSDGNNGSSDMKSSGGISLISTVYAALGRMAQWITKTSSSCNETDQAKKRYSRNGLWIGRYEN